MIEILFEYARILPLILFVLGIREGVILYTTWAKTNRKNGTFHECNERSTSYSTRVHKDPIFMEYGEKPPVFNDIDDSELADPVSVYVTEQHDKGNYDFSFSDVAREIGEYPEWQLT